MTPILEINDLVVRYRSASLFEILNKTAPRYVTVLPGVSLVIKPGETLGLVGESGSGKTTLGRAVAGLSPLSGGSISLDGTAVTGSKDQAWKDIRRNVGMMFQDAVAALDPRMTLGASVTEALAIHGARGIDRRQRARELLTEVGLPAEFAVRYPHQISGGQARRVTVARALALRPKLVIADEPTAGLDLSVQGELLNLLNVIQSSLGVSFLLITHNLAVARHVTDRIAVMYLGRIVEIGATADLFARPAHPYTRALLGTRATRKSQPPLAGEGPSLRHRPSGCEFHTRCPIARLICSKQPPPDVTTGPQHFTRCHFPLADPVDTAVLQRTAL
jgi:peptide/nickel transport system ATP-binding protein